MRNSEDAYSTVIVEDLLRASQDWKGAPEVVRLTLKALLEVVKSQGHSMRELIQSVPQKVDRGEFESHLSQKADYSQVSSQISDLRENLENRSLLLDIQASLDEKVSFSDFTFHLNSKAANEDLASLNNNSKQEIKALQQELLSKVERLEVEIGHQLKTFALEQDLENLKNDIRKKANSVEVDDSFRYIEEKLITQVNKKANRNEVESALARKADAAELQRTIFALESKAEQEVIEQLMHAMDTKLDIAEMEHKYLPLIHAKANKEEFSDVSEVLKDVKMEAQRSVKESSNSAESLFHSLKTELEKLRNEITSQLAVKTDVKDFDKVLGLMQKKADNEMVSEWLKQQKKEFQDSISKKHSDLLGSLKVQDDNLQQRIAAASQSLEFLNSEHKKMHEYWTVFKNQQSEEKEHTAKLVRQVMGASKTEFADELRMVSEATDQLKRSVEELNSVKANKIDVLESLQKVYESLDTKNTQEEFDKYRENTQEFFDQSLEQIKTNQENMKNHFNSSLEQMVESLTSMIDSKADATQVDELIESSASLESFVNISKDLAGIQEALQQRAIAGEVDTNISQLRTSIINIEKDIAFKANIKDLSSLLNSKADVEEINKALLELHQEIDTKADMQQFTEHVTEQTLINETLCTEVTLGRWIWKNGELRGGSTVLWDLQSVNTCPENFVWEPDSAPVSIVAPGLYEVALGFFGRKKPTASILVNGEPVLSAMNKASHVVQHSSGRLKNISGTTISGLTLIDFLVLPAKARVTIRYTGEPGEGFMSIRKL